MIVPKRLIAAAISAPGRVAPGIHLLCAVVMLVGCTTVHTTKPINASGRSTRYLATDTPGPVHTSGIDSQDIVSMTDGMVRDILANPNVAGLDKTPRVRIDSALLRNESSQRINLNLFTDRMRTGLVRSSKGRILFVTREDVDELVKERGLKRRGIVDDGGLGRQAKMAGVDYRLRGRIMDHIGISNSTGMQSRYFQIVLELVDQETGVIVWGDLYEFKKVWADDAIYR